MLFILTGLLLLDRPVMAVKNQNFYHEQPDATSAITFDGRGFIINGQRTFVASGDLHYPRVPQAMWHDRLLRLKRSGLNCVQTYAFMNYHSPQPGAFDFSGEKDFNLYLQDIHDLGLHYSVRAGLYVCSEWDNGGYPEWLLSTRRGDSHHRTSIPGGRRCLVWTTSSRSSPQTRSTAADR